MTGAARGYFYTFTVLVVLAGLLAFFLTNTDLTSSSRGEQTRVRSMDAFLDDIAHDAERAAYIAGFRAFIALEDQVSSTGLFLSPLEPVFTSAFVDGEYGNATYAVLSGATFSEYLERMQLKASDVGIAVDATVVDVLLYQIDPWAVAVDVTVAFVVNDTRGLASWSFNETFSSTIPIFDLRDPLYGVGTQGKATNTIRRLPNGTQFVDDAGDRNDTTVLALMLDQSYYVADALAPSFLMRLEGNASANPYGITSLVNLEELDRQNVPVFDERSIVDYQYFLLNATADWCDIQNMNVTFKLDDDHLEFFEVDPELEYDACP